MYYDLTQLDQQDPIKLRFTANEGSGQHLISDSHHIIAGLIELLGAIEIKGKAIDSIDCTITVSQAELEGAVCANVSGGTTDRNGCPIRIIFSESQESDSDDTLGSI